MIINNDLPEICYTNSLADPEQVVAVQQGKSGYYPLETRYTAEHLNGALNIDPKAVDVMVAGSMFGWEIPAVTNYKKH